MAKRIANPIAVRRYGVAGEPGREVVLTIGKPRPDPKRPERWACTVLLEGLPDERRRRGRGVDAVQALQDAMMYARHELDRCAIPLTWLEGEADDFGLPHAVPSYPGSGIRQKVEHYIDQQLKKSIRKAKERQAAKRSGA
jgi:hypothetical protein